METKLVNHAHKMTQAASTVNVMKNVFVFFTDLSLHVFFLSSRHNLHVLASSLSRNMGGLAEYESGRFRLPKSLQEDYLFSQSNTKSTAVYKDKWAVEIFRNWQAVREQKFPSVDPGSVFKDYDVHRVQSLQEKKRT